MKRAQHRTNLSIWEARARKRALRMPVTSPRRRLILTRLKAGLSQHQMAAELGMQWDTYRRYEAELDAAYVSTPNLRAAIAIRDMTAERGDEIDPGDWLDEQAEELSEVRSRRK